jgi:hypothetical protein
MLFILLDVWCCFYMKDNNTLLEYINVSTIPQLDEKEEESVFRRRVPTCNLP